MYGTTIYQFTPEQLVKEMLANIDANEELTLTQAHNLYGRVNVDKWIEEGQLPWDRNKGEYTKMRLKRIDIERIVLTNKYLKS